MPSSSHLFIALLIATVVCGCGPTSPEIRPPEPPLRVDRHGPPPTVVAHPRIEHRLYLRAVQGGGALTVQLRPQLGQPVSQIRSEDLRRLGASAIIRGTTLIQADLEASRLLPLVERLPAVGWIELVEPEEPDVGPNVSQGLALIDADRFHCRGAGGKGLKIAVLDVGFETWAAAKAAGELPVTFGTPPGNGSTHGTSVAEVIADLAPEATLLPVLASTRAQLEQFIKQLSGSGVSVINRSLSSIGGGFGDGTGYWCERAKEVKAAGALWVNSAGNYAVGKSYRAAFLDSDSDGWHEFAAGDEQNSFTVNSTARIRFQLDWDDWPATSQDLDLYLYRWDTATKAWIVAAKSTNAQTGSQEPREFVSVSKPVKGSYALGVHRKAGTKPVALRLLVISGAITLQFAHAAGSLNTASSCADILAVGAIPYWQYATGPQNPSSSLGPTWDGRIKPDIAAPTKVATSPKSDFGGTSAAAPHVAGAVALLISATGQGALAAGQLAIKDAVPMGSPTPNNVYGAGRLRLDATRAGWACALGAVETCTTTCGSAGTRSCKTDCSWPDCAPPAEQCNGKDDDCDGAADNGFPCAAGATRPCSTSCGTPGAETCAETTCSWGACAATAVEICNGKDDDCNGAIDDGIGPCADAAAAGDAGAGDAGAAVEEGQGCSCAVEGRAPVGPSALALLLALLLLCRPRRR
jgi:Subtilase family/Putative metal-binding motif